jgi:hypothetical protein
MLFLARLVVSLEVDTSCLFAARVEDFEGFDDFDDVSCNFAARWLQLQVVGRTRARRVNKRKRWTNGLLRSRSCSFE